MNCERFKDIILTDYLDEEMKPLLKKVVDNHLTQCRDCRKFTASARKNLIEPFAQAQKILPPDSLWDRIQEAVVNKQRTPQGLFSSVVKKLGLIVHAPSPVFALQIMVILIFIAGMASPFIIKFAGSQKSTADLEYFSDLVSAPDEGPAGERDYGTAIEKYFL